MMEVQRNSEDRRTSDVTAYDFGDTNDDLTRKFYYLPLRIADFLCGESTGSCFDIKTAF